METELKLGHYPFKTGESQTRVHTEFGKNLERLLNEPIFAYKDKDKIFDFISTAFTKADDLFETEARLRKQGAENANLFYHGREHAVYQAGFDSITTARAILNINPRVAKYLSPESVTSMVIAASWHDTGYVSGTTEDCNFASRQNVHVAESINAANKMLGEIQIPDSLSSTKIKQLVPIGIHATNFPFTEENKHQRKEMLIDMDAKDKKEAMVVALSVQLADLGGQVARVDYMNNLLDLRREFNCVTEGMGDQIIGKDHEIPQKCKEFIETVVDKTVGRTANAFFGRGENVFSLEWHKHSEKGH